jgi:hypothetical protein
MAIHGDSVAIRKLKYKKYEIRNKINFFKKAIVKYNQKIKVLKEDLKKIMREIG